MIDFYPYLKPLLFSLDPERAHAIASRGLCYSRHLGIPRFLYPPIKAPLTVFELEFSNPVGLAAGFDKNASHLDDFASLGFGFLEVGTLTPRPQPGNPRPRVFRLVENEALLNRFGFNNIGVVEAVKNIRRSRYRGVLGVNIGKNADTPIENALDDYLCCLRETLEVASYITVNLSSPNTAGLRTLQTAENLRRLLHGIFEERERLLGGGRRVPILIKLAPDLHEEEMAGIVNVLFEVAADGVIATNTTTSRKDFLGTRWEHEAGGISGAPLKPIALSMFSQLSCLLQGKIPLVASGGIMSGEDARQFVALGASLCQIYTGLIYRGPSLVAEVARACER